MQGPSLPAGGDAPPQASGYEADVGIFADINITPLVDVVLVLLVIFMITSSAMVDAAKDSALHITLPEATGPAGDASGAEILVVAMGADGRLFVDGAFLSEAELAERLRQTAREAPATQVLVDADGALSHRAVVRVLDLVRAAGFGQVGIGTDASQIQGQAP